MGLHITDLDSLDFGTVMDMMTESGNDSHQYKQLANQDDFDKF